MNDKSNIKDKVIDVLTSCGFDICLDNINEELDYDSLQFVSTMVELENTFQIQIPDENLLGDGLNTASDIIDMIINIIKFDTD